MSAPITPNPSIHSLPPAEQQQQHQIDVQQLEALGEQLIQTVINAVLSLISGGFLGGGGLFGFLNLIPGGSIFSNLFQNFFSMFGIGGAGSTNPITGLLGDPGSFNASSPLTSWITDIMDPLGLLMGPNSPLNAGNLFGQIPADLLSLLHIGNLGNSPVELLNNGGFNGLQSIGTVGPWTWDSVEGHTSPGSASTTGNGLTKSLFSDPIQVAAAQSLTTSVWTKWSGLVSSGTPIQLNIAKYLDGSLVGYDNISVVNSPGSSGGWIQMGNTYTVPSGVDRVRLKLTVGNTATAGTVWFDDASLTKTGQIQQNWVQDLVSNFTSIFGVFGGSGILSEFLNGFTNLLSIFGGPSLNGSPTSFNVSSLWTTVISDIIDPLNLLTSFGDFSSLLNGLFDGVAGNSSGTSSGKSILDVFNIFSGFFGGSGIFESLLNNIFDGLSGTTGTTGTGVGGILSIFQDLMNNLFDGMNGTSGSSGMGILDVFNIFQGVNNNLFGGITGQDTSSQSATQAEMGVAVANQASTVIGTASLLAQALAGISGGNRDSDDFERTSSTDLGANWDIQHTGTITVSTSDGHDAVFSSGFLASGEATCRKTDVQAAGDVHVSSIVLKSTPASLGANGHNDVWCRMSNFSSFATRTGVRARYDGSGGLTLSWFNSGTETVLNSGTAAIKAAAGSTLSLEAGQGTDAHHYVIKMNGTPIMDFQDTGMHSSTGTGFRYRGFGGKSESVLVNFMPGSVNQFTASG